jgi:hypothetical protein
MPYRRVRTVKLKGKIRIGRPKKEKRFEAPARIRAQRRTALPAKRKADLWGTNQTPPMAIAVRIKLKPIER